MNNYPIISLLLILLVAIVVLIYLPAKPKDATAAPPLVLKAPEEITALTSVYATEAEQEATFMALAKLSHIGVRADGSLIDWRTGARITSCPAEDEFPTHLTIRYPGEKRICILSRRGLNQFHALQIAISTQLAGGV